MDHCVTLRADGHPVQVVRVSTPDGDEWVVLEDYVREAEQLRQCKHVAAGAKIELSLHYDATRGIRHSTTPMESDDVDAVAMRLRPFVLDSERTSFHRCANLLHRRLRHLSAFDREIRAIKETFELKRGSLSIKGPTGREILSRDAVMDYLNSYLYHRDAQKRRRLEAETPFFDKDVRQGVAMLAINEMIKAVLGLADFIETLAEVRDGRRTEIRVLPAHLSESE